MGDGCARPLVASSSNDAPVVDSTNVLLVLSWDNEEPEAGPDVLRFPRRPAGTRACGTPSQSDSYLPRRVAGPFPLKWQAS